MRDPEDVAAQVLVLFFWITFGVLSDLRPGFIEGIRDVLEEDQAEDDVLVFAGVEVAA